MKSVLLPFGLCLLTSVQCLYITVALIVHATHNLVWIYLSCFTYCSCKLYLLRSEKKLFNLFQVVNLKTSPLGSSFQFFNLLSFHFLLMKSIDSHAGQNFLLAPLILCWVVLCLTFVLAKPALLPSSVAIICCFYRFLCIHGKTPARLPSILFKSLLLCCSALY